MHSNNIPGKDCSCTRSIATGNTVDARRLFLLVVSPTFFNSLDYMSAMSRQRHTGRTRRRRPERLIQANEVTRECKTKPCRCERDVKVFIVKQIDFSKSTHILYMYIVFVDYITHNCSFKQDSLSTITMTL